MRTVTCEPTAATVRESRRDVASGRLLGQAMGTIVVAIRSLGKARGIRGLPVRKDARTPLRQRSQTAEETSLATMTERITREDTERTSEAGPKAIIGGETTERTGTGRRIRRKRRRRRRSESRGEEEKRRNVGPERKTKMERGKKDGERMQPAGKTETRSRNTGGNAARGPVPKKTPKLKGETFQAQRNHLS